MRKTTLLYVFICILFVNKIYAIHPVIRNFNKKTTTGGTQNWDIIQYNNDWMYFANNKGLLEFDGNRWTIYPIKNYTNVRSLLYDGKSDRIYAGAFNEFGYYKRDKNGILKYNSLIDKVKQDERNFNEIWSISKIDNTVFFQSDKMIFKLKNEVINCLAFPEKIDCSALVGNNLFVANSKTGISILNGNLFMKLPNSEILNNKKVCAILPYQKSKILFITDFHGIFVYNGINVEKFKTDIDEFLTQNQVFCATIENDDLAIGTVRNGLVVKNLRTNLNIYSNTFTGLQNNTILSLCYDKQHNLWLGLDKGIDYVQINSPVYDLFENNQLLGSGYCSLNLKDILYLGTNQGLYTTPFPIESSPRPLPINLIPAVKGQIWCLKLIDNTIFCGSDYGAFMIKGAKTIKIQELQGTWGFRKLNNHPNCIIGSSYQGFFILKKINDEWQFSNFVKGFNENGEMFEEDKDGKIWFCHWINGISRLTLNEDLTEFSKIELIDKNKGLPSNRENGLYLLKDMLVISTQNGFFNYNFSKNKVERNDKLEKIFGRQQYSTRLSENGKGDIWCTSYKYIGVASKQKSNIYSVDSISFSTLKKKLINGFENLNFINDSNIILSTEDGFSWLDLSKINKEKSRFAVFIRNVYLTNENDSIVCGYKAQQTDIPEFEYKHNSIRFEYVAPEFRNEGSVTYSYLLENYDSKWSSYSLVNSKEYTKLKKGSYIFRVKSKSLLESEVVETEYKFVILPPWYESNTATIIYIILLLFVLLFLVRIVNLRSKKGAREMEKRKEIELKEQEQKFEAESLEKQKEIIELKNQQLQYDLRNKSQELANSTMNLIRKNEILLEVAQSLNEITEHINTTDAPKTIVNDINTLQTEIKKNIERDDNWKHFAENFDLVYENYLKRLGEQFPNLTTSDKKMCAYLKMNLSSKEIAPLLNMSYRSVEMSRYRLRKKMQLEREINLSEFLQNF